MNNNSFNDIFNLTWFPWVGKNYGETNAPKILIVGESHYHNGTDESIFKHKNPEYTRITINELAIEGDYWNTKIFQNLHKTLFLNNEFQSKDLWDNVAYCNFIQQVMHTTKGRPKAEDFRQGWATFFELLSVLKPTLCLFIGNSAANYLSKAAAINSEFSVSEVTWQEHINGAYGKLAFLKDAAGNETKLVFIKHTSQRFTYLIWHNYLKNIIPKEMNWLNLNVSQSLKV